MHYRRLIGEAKKFHDKFGSNPTEHVYSDSIRPNYINWQRLSLADSERIFYFLNAWGRCRMKCKSQRLLEVRNEIATFQKVVKDLMLEDSEPNPLISLDDERMKLQRIVHFVFDTIRNLKGYGPVPTSKTLHLINPSLFVMWDTPICRKLYRLRLNGYSYAYKFMPKMKRELDEAITSCMSDRGVSRREAIQWMRNEIERVHGVSRTLAKTVDEYNWILAPR